jgi:hypothetical protein
VVGPVGRVLAVEVAQHAVEVGLVVGQLTGQAEEGLGRHGEELAHVGGAVRVEQVATLAGAEQLELPGADLDPAVVGHGVGQGRGPVDEQVEHVELVGQLVQDHVAAPLRVAGVPPGGVPGDQHRTAVVGLAQQVDVALGEGAVHLAGLDLVPTHGPGMHDHGGDVLVGVDAFGAAEHQQGGQRADHRADLVGELEAMGRLPPAGGHELVEELGQAKLLVGVELAPVGHAGARRWPPSRGPVQRDWRRKNRHRGDGGTSW